jgi:hypothetical protein
MKILILATFLILPLCATIDARSHTASAKQSQRSKADQKRESSITGRLVAESGQPIPNAIIYVRRAGKLRDNSRSTSTDDEGRFRVNDLARGVYRVSPNAPGYVLTDEQAGGLIYRAGDTANIRMSKGGVITGTVTNSSGEPMIAMTVHAIQVKEKDGRAISSGKPDTGDATTDDRGVYRLYGLISGSYLVIVSGRNEYSNELNAYENDMPVYYPSSTRDTAMPVTLRVGEEMTGIDIRYRDEPGHAISGNVVGGSTEDLPAIGGGLNLNLIHASSNLIEATVHVNPRRSGRPFDIYGVPDGEYYINAQQYDYSGKGAIATGRARVKVKGADVTGLEITLLPLGSITGTITIHAARETIKCEIKQRISLDETIIKARRDEKEDKNETPLAIWDRLQTVPTDKGEFTINSVEAGRHRMEYNFIGEDWYVRSVTLPSPVPAKPAIDVARNGFAVKQGERVAGLNITLAEGAAGIKGKVVSATESARLPDRLRVHLVPAEKVSANDVLRFAEVMAQSDGSFSISNLAPGRYWIIALPATDDNSSARPQPTAWDSNDRAALRNAAEATNVVLELQACQRVLDYSIKYAPTSPATKKTE